MRALEVEKNLNLKAVQLTKSELRVFGFCPAGSTCKVGLTTLPGTRKYLSGTQRSAACGCSCEARRGRNQCILLSNNVLPSWLIASHGKNESEQKRSSPMAFDGLLFFEPRGLFTSKKNHLAWLAFGARKDRLSPRAHFQRRGLPQGSWTFGQLALPSGKSSVGG